MAGFEITHFTSVFLSIDVRSGQLVTFQKWTIIKFRVTLKFEEKNHVKNMVKKTGYTNSKFENLTF